ncbi:MULTISPECIES: hypothetical protein [Thalassospira]|uniref:Uncharacterized protein n=1 Tax=Thalassospira profundimaris TaxID=502049 RepID=A0A367WWA3_9PROT|nr:MULTISPECIES: hypothetical protein [Thalassospira]OKH88082.1 hypothetical protein LF95_15520 [Thalassospira sp. TSL5-1]RCK44781.1 hypothetical protein TH25_19150 [Thalassospira profundimaris]
MLFNNTQAVVSQACRLAADTYAYQALEYAGAAVSCRKTIELILDCIEIGQLGNDAETFLNMAAVYEPKYRHGLDFCLDVLSQIKGGH